MCVLWGIIRSVLAFIGCQWLNLLTHYIIKPYTVAVHRESNFISRYFCPTKQTSLVLHQPPNNIWYYHHEQKNRHRNWERCCFSPVSLSDVIPIQTLPTQSRGSAQHPLSPWLQHCICHTPIRRTTQAAVGQCVCTDRHFVQWERRRVMSLKGQDWSRDVYLNAECQRSSADAPT